MMIDLSIIEKASREFCKGIDRLNLAYEYNDKYTLSKSNKNSKKIMRESIENVENTADFVVRAIDIMLKAMAYIYIPDIDPIDVRGHRQTNVINLLKSNYDIAPDLKEIDDLLDNILHSASTIHDFISSMAYEGNTVYDKTLTRFFDFADRLKDFGFKHGLNDFEKFLKLHK